MIIVTLTYVTLVMRADNDGEGGIMALITLLRRWGGAQDRRTVMALAALGLSAGEGNDDAAPGTALQT